MDARALSLAPTTRRCAGGGLLAALLTPALVRAQGTAPAQSPAQPQPGQSPPPGGTPPQQGAAAETLKTGTDFSERMTTPVFLNGQGPFNFIVDTGANQSGLSAEVAAQLQLPAGAQVKVHGIAAVFLAQSANVDDLHVGSIHTPLQNAPLFKRSDLGADGLIGLDILHDRLLTLDFDRNRIEIAHRNYGRPAGRSLATLNVPGPAGGEVVVPARQRFGQLTIIDADAGRAHMTCFIDTGADQSVGNEALRLAVEAKMDPAQIVNIDVVIHSVTGQTIPAVIARVPNMRIGGVAFSEFGLAFADLHTFDIWGLNGQPALLVGMDLLRLFDSVAIDFGQREVTFQPK